jgi:hypothetical protein
MTSGFTVQSIPEQLASLKKWDTFFFDLNGFPCPGIAANAGVPFLDGKRAKPAQFDPVAPRHGICDFFKNGIHDPLDIALIEMRVFVGDFLNQF